MAISVIIPVYNCAEWLGSCLDSALQFDIVTEVIVIDDGSTDSSSDIVKTYIQKDNRIQAFTHDQRVNLGRSASRNLGLMKATQEWIAFLDADDYYLSNRFDGIDFTNNADGYYGVVRSESEGRALDPKIIGVEGFVEPSELYKHLTEEPNSYFSIISLTIRRKLVLAVRGFDETLDRGEDTDFIWSLAHSYQLNSMVDSSPIAVRRLHDRNHDRNLEDRSPFYTKWLTEPPYATSQKAQKRLFFARMEFHQRGSKLSKFNKRMQYYYWRLTGQLYV